MTKTLVEHALLVSRDSDADVVNVRDGFGNTPLHLAAMSDERLDIAIMLRSFGASAHALNGEGMSVFEVAMMSMVNPAPMMQSLREKGRRRGGAK